MLFAEQPPIESWDPEEGSHAEIQSQVTAGGLRRGTLVNVETVVKVEMPCRDIGQVQVTTGSLRRGNSRDSRNRSHSSDGKEAMEGDISDSRDRRGGKEAMKRYRAR